MTQHLPYPFENRDEWHRAWLADNGFDAIGEWALDQDYRFDKSTDTWLDDEGQPVDLDEKLEKHLEDEANRYLDSLD